MITLRQLQVFIAIAKNSNMTQAAEEIYLSQSAISMALSELEKQLDAQVFDRLGKRLLLNNNGKALLPKAIAILDQAKELTNLNKLEQEGELNIGASSTIGNYLLPKYMTQFKQQHNKINILLRIGNTEQIINDVLTLKLDVGYIEGIYHHPELTIIPFHQDKLVVFARKNHPLTHQEKISYKDLSASQWVMREKGSGTRQFVEFALQEKLRTIDIFLELNHSEAVKQTVQNCDAISCLSKLCLSSAVSKQKLVILQTPPLNLSRKLHIIMHKNKFRTGIINRWLEQYGL